MACVRRHFIPQPMRKLLATFSSNHELDNDPSKLDRRWICDFCSFMLPPKISENPGSFESFVALYDRRQKCPFCNMLIASLGITGQLETITQLVQRGAELTFDLSIKELDDLTPSPRDAPQISRKGRAAYYQITCVVAGLESEFKDSWKETVLYRGHPLICCSDKSHQRSNSLFSERRIPRDNGKH